MEKNKLDGGAYASVFLSKLHRLGYLHVCFGFHISLPLHHSAFLSFFRFALSFINFACIYLWLFVSITKLALSISLPLLLCHHLLAHVLHFLCLYSLLPMRRSASSHLCNILSLLISVLPLHYCGETSPSRYALHPVSFHIFA